MEEQRELVSMSRALETLIAQLPQRLCADGYDAVSVTCRRQLEEILYTLQAVESLKAWEVGKW